MNRLFNLVLASLFQAQHQGVLAMLGALDDPEPDFSDAQRSRSKRRSQRKKQPSQNQVNLLYFSNLTVIRVFKSVLTPVFVEKTPKKHKP